MSILRVHLRKDLKNKNNEHPVVITYSHDKKTRRFPTHVTVREKDWNDEVLESDAEHLLKNEAIKVKYNKLDRLKFEMLANNVPPTTQRLVEALKPKIDTSTSNLLKLWLEGKKRSIKESSYLAYEREANTWTKFETYKDDLLDQDLKTNTINSRLSMMNNFLSFCESEGVVLCAKHSLVSKRGETTTVLYLLEDEMDKLITCRSYGVGEEVRMAWVLNSTNMGLRFSDLINLTNDNFYTENGQVWVRVATQKRGSEIAVPLSPTGLEVYNKIKDRTGAIFQIPQRNNLFIKASRALFYNAVMTRKVEVRSNKPKQVEVKEGQLCDMITSHVMRHSFAYRFLSGGGRMPILQKILGHKNLATTANMYGHIDNQSVAKEQTDKYNEVAAENVVEEVEEEPESTDYIDDY